MHKFTSVLFLTILALVAGMSLSKPAQATPTPTLKPSRTPTRTATVAQTHTASPTPSDTPSSTGTQEPTPVVTDTPFPTATPPSGSFSQPYPSAPLCPDTGALHNNSLFHTLWDGVRGCHYDHEHGQDPFTAAVAAAFPGFDLRSLLGGVEIGHQNPTSAAEFNAKGNGMKWQVTVPAPQGCVTGFEGAPTGADAAVIEYHAFGDYAIELDADVHSTVSLIRQCQVGSSDYGYIFAVQHQRYGELCVPYQGTYFPYPHDSVSPYNCGFGPYITVDCVGPVARCRPSLDFILSHFLNAASKWTSKATGSGAREEGSRVFRLLFNVRDVMRVIDWNDQTYPYTFLWLCGGATYNPVGCRYTNSTTTITEIAGEVPTAWDNLPWDSDPRVGRITAEGFVSRFGMPVEPGACALPGMGCFPIKLVAAYTGQWGAELSAEKVSTLTKTNTPSRNIWFCNGLPCQESDPGAMPSGWIGPEN